MVITKIEAEYDIEKNYWNAYCYEGNKVCNIVGGSSLISCLGN